jgi:hypothetical protein
VISEKLPCHVRQSRNLFSNNTALENERPPSFVKQTLIIESVGVKKLERIKLTIDESVEKLNEMEQPDVRNMCKACKLFLLNSVRGARDMISM